MLAYLDVLGIHFALLCRKRQIGRGAVMTNRDECVAILDNFGEEQLSSVVVVLKGMNNVF